MNGLYEISNLGNVKSLIKPYTKKEKILKPFKNENGYMIIRLTKHNIAKNFRVHSKIKNPERLSKINNYLNDNHIPRIG